MLWQSVISSWQVNPKRPRLYRFFLQISEKLPLVGFLVQYWLFEAIAIQMVNPCTAKFNILNFQLLKVVSRYRDPQPEVVENFSYLFYLWPRIGKYLSLNTQLLPDTSDLVD